MNIRRGSRRATRKKWKGPETAHSIYRTLHLLNIPHLQPSYRPPPTSHSLHIIAGKVILDVRLIEGLCLGCGVGGLVGCFMVGGGS